MKQAKFLLFFVVALAMMFMVGCTNSVASSSANSNPQTSNNLPGTGETNPGNPSESVSGQSDDYGLSDNYGLSDDYGLSDVTPAEDFLAEFTSLFSLGSRHQGNYYQWFNEGRLDDIPLVSVEFGWPPVNWVGGSVFDREGNLISIDEVPFLHEIPAWDGDGISSLIAVNFTLFDFNNDGIPEILIRYTAETWAIHVLYKYVDGQYQAVDEREAGADFFTDETGRLVMVAFDTGIVDIYYITLNDYGLTIDEQFAMSEEEFFENLHESLTPVEPLNELREEISTSVKRRLGIKP